MRRMCFAVLLMSLSLPLAIGAAQEGNASANGKIRIGYVDLVRAMAESEGGKKAQEQLKKEAKRSEQSLVKQKNRVEKLKNEIEKKGMVLREEEQQALARDYRDGMRSFERQYKDAEEDLKIRDRQLSGKILVELHQIVAELGEKGDYTIILEGNNTVVLYGKRNIDLTDDVIESHNKRFASGKKQKKG